MDERAITDPRALDWIDAGSLMSLPDGVRVKRLSQSKATGIRKFLVRFAPGYGEPRHAHASDHSTFLLEGRRIVEGKEFAPGYVEPRHMHKSTDSDVLLEGRWIIEGQEVLLGGHIYGPTDMIHGPFACPGGVVVCGSSFGLPIHESD